VRQWVRLQTPDAQQPKHAVLFCYMLRKWASPEWLAGAAVCWYQQRGCILLAGAACCTWGCPAQPGPSAQCSREHPDLRTNDVWSRTLGRRFGPRCLV
jgi:hypothetical protein